MNHFYRDIAGWFNFEGPYRQAVEEATDGAVFVELGCWKGRSSAFLAVEVLNSGKEIELHFVDHWGGSNEPEHKADPDLERIYEVFKQNIESVSGVDVMIHRMRTVEAADLFEDRSVDFIWVDAGHEYEDVISDLRAWWPKLAVGGVMGGDDLPMDGVKRAVKEYFPSHEVGSENGWQWWRVRKRD
jgi:hypothetical protein